MGSRGTSLLVVGICPGYVPPTRDTISNIELSRASAASPPAELARCEAHMGFAHQRTGVSKGGSCQLAAALRPFTVVLWYTNTSTEGEDPKSQ